MGSEGPPVRQDLDHHIRGGARVARFDGQVARQRHIDGRPAAPLHAQHGLHTGQCGQCSCVWRCARACSVRQDARPASLRPGMHAEASKPHLHLSRHRIHHACIVQLLHQHAGGRLQQRQQQQWGQARAAATALAGGCMQTGAGAASQHTAPLTPPAWGAAGAAAPANVRGSPKCDVAGRSRKRRRSSLVGPVGPWVCGAGGVACEARRVPSVGEGLHRGPRPWMANQNKSFSRARQDDSPWPAAAAPAAAAAPEAAEVAWPGCCAVSCAPARV